ncbi:putative integral membrane protein, partial [Toxoplasma gondii ARI]
VNLCKLGCGGRQHAQPKVSRRVAGRRLVRCGVEATCFVSFHGRRPPFSRRRPSPFAEPRRRNGRQCHRHLGSRSRNGEWRFWGGSLSLESRETGL